MPALELEPKKNNYKIIAGIILAMGVLVAVIIFFWPQILEKFDAWQAQQALNKHYNVPISEQDSVLGNPNAQVTLVEFADFNCPYCLEIEPTLKKLRAEFKNSVKFVYKDYISVGGQRIAEAARCAQDQNAFEQFHDDFFLGQVEASPAGYLNFAKDHYLNLDTFSQCLETRKYQNFIESSTQLGQQLGVTATPTFFINGIKNVGVLPEEVFRAKLKNEGATN